MGARGVVIKHLLDDTPVRVITHNDGRSGSPGRRRQVVRQAEAERAAAIGRRRRHFGVGARGRHRVLLLGEVVDIEDVDELSMKKKKKGRKEGKDREGGRLTGRDRTGGCDDTWRKVS